MTTHAYPRRLKASDLSKEKQAFLLKALASSRGKLDKLLAYFPKEQVSLPRRTLPASKSDFRRGPIDAGRAGERGVRRGERQGKKSFSSAD